MYYDPTECGMRISKLRMECGKTQQQMADKLNISLDHYRALENGRRGGSLDLLIELAITFDISLDYLILGRVKYSDSERIPVVASFPAETGRFPDTSNRRYGLFASALVPYISYLDCSFVVGSYSYRLH